jgi:hypothetical protein
MHSCRERYNCMRGHDQWVGQLAASLIAATDLLLVGVLASVNGSVAVMATIMTVGLGSGAHDETLLGGGHHYPGSPPDRGDGWGLKQPSQRSISPATAVAAAGI